MANYTRFLIPLLGGAGVVLTILTILDFDDKICNACWQVDTTMFFTYILLGLATLAAVIGSVVGVLSKPGSLKNSLIGIVSLVVITAAGYGLASDEILSYYPDTVSALEVKLSGAGLYMLYILFIGAVASILFSSVFSLIRK